MRTFVALDLRAEIRGRIEQFIREVRSLAPEARWVRAESLHVTLKFIGEKPDDTVKRMQPALASIRRPGFQLLFRGTGFFPTPGAARVFWVGIESEQALAELAKDIEQRLAPLGIQEEKRAFSPHLTLARAGSGSGAPGWRAEDRPNRQFAKLRDMLQGGERDFGGMMARDFFLYSSQLSPAGAKYRKIARFELKE
jgi:RNA 2',3'-cyclic 3'-phosphodiesterase